MTYLNGHVAQTTNSRWVWLLAGPEGLPVASSIRDFATLAEASFDMELYVPRFRNVA
jgi:hypothetical protein